MGYAERRFCFSETLVEMNDRMGERHLKLGTTRILNTQKNGLPENMFPTSRRSVSAWRCNVLHSISLLTSYFVQTMNAFHAAAHTLHRKITGLLAVRLALPLDFFEPYVKKKANHLRLLHYPPSRQGPAGNTRFKTHSDVGTVRPSLFQPSINPGQLILTFLSFQVTLLWQDQVGGLGISRTGRKFHRCRTSSWDFCDRQWFRTYTVQ